MTDSFAPWYLRERICKFVFTGYSRSCRINIQRLLRGAKSYCSNLLNNLSMNRFFLYVVKGIELTASGSTRCNRSFLRALQLVLYATTVWPRAKATEERNKTGIPHDFFK